MKRPFFFMLISLAIIGLSASCVPLAIGAAGAVGGYIARDSGVGVVEPAGEQDTYYEY